MRKRTQWRSAAIPVLSGLVLVLAAAIPAAASPVDSNRAEASRIAQKREALVHQAESLNEQRKATQVKLDQITIDLDLTKAAVALKVTSATTLEAETVSVVVKSYVFGEQGSAADLLLTISGTGIADGVAREGYASVLIGAASDKLDALQAAREDAERLGRDLAERQSRLASLAVQLKNENAAVAKTQFELTALSTKVDGELVQLVAAETRRREEAEAGKARAEVERQRKEFERQAQLQREVLEAKRVAEADAARAAAARVAAARNTAAPAPRPAVPAPPSIGDIRRAPAPTPAAAVAVSEALRQLGKPYIFGTNGPDTFDCSGLTQWAWGRAGVSMVHYTGAQATAFPRVSAAELQPGDLVFFNIDLGHMGMYIGNSQIVQAPRTGDVVKVTPLNRAVVVVAVRPG